MIAMLLVVFIVSCGDTPVNTDTDPATSNSDTSIPNDSNTDIDTDQNTDTDEPIGPDEGEDLNDILGPDWTLPQK